MSSYITCKNCGHIQLIDRTAIGDYQGYHCERCGGRLQTEPSPWIMVTIAVVVIAGALILRMPPIMIIIPAIFGVVFLISALASTGGKNRTGASRRMQRANFSSPLSEIIEKRTRFRKCETCDRIMEKVIHEENLMMITKEEKRMGIGVAEECQECGRFYCDQCYPSRPKNTCVCGLGRDKIGEERGVIYKGSMRLAKVRYQ